MKKTFQLLSGKLLVIVLKKLTKSIFTKQANKSLVTINHSLEALIPTLIDRKHAIPIPKANTSSPNISPPPPC